MSTPIGGGDTGQPENRRLTGAAVSGPAGDSPATGNPVAGGPSFSVPSFYVLRQVFQPRELVILAVLLIEIGLFRIISPGFTTANEFLSAARYVSLTGIAAVGASLVIIAGGIDLSPGALYGLAGMVMAYLMAYHHVAAPAAMAAALVAGLAVGCFNGVGVAYLGIPPFIVTLGTFSICGGLSQWITNGENLPSYDHPFGPGVHHYLDLLRFQIGAHGSDQGIAVSMIVMIALAIIAAFFLVATPTGRYIHAIGGNEQAARHAGIRVPAVKVIVYALAGLLASVSGIFYVAQYGSMNSGVGPGQELDIIAAAVVGGVSLQGGKGSPIGAIIGAYIITMLRDGLVFNNVPDAGARVAVGAFIILAVVIDRALKGLDGMRLAAMRGRLRR